MIRSLVLSVIASSLAFAAAAPDTSAVVERAGRGVEKFWDEISSVTCTELVTQDKLTPEGKLLLERKGTFDYLTLLQFTDGELSVEESRIERNVSGHKTDRPLLTTAGFSTMLLVFHPHFQSSYEFSEGVPEGGTRVIRFRHRKGSRSPSVLELRGRMYPLEWEGEASVDAATGSISHIRAGLVTPMTDVGLQTLAIDVTYAPVKIAAERLVLPEMAVIEARTVRQRWRNIHRFTDYKKFSVDAQTKAETPATTPSQEKKSK
jgi:hypothetical protein